MRTPFILRCDGCCPGVLLPVAANVSARLQTGLRPSAPQPAAKHQGFFDYALGKINPHGNDYGASIESKRNAIVGNTIDDLYFWSNVATLLLLSGLVGVVLLRMARCR